ncbi:MAG: four helix bundle protein [Cyclobacteriaceae bacterium]
MNGKTFEELKVWQDARLLNQFIYKSTREALFSMDFPLRDQIRRSSISVMSNIAEGYERDGNKELIQFLSIAKGSVGELRCQLIIAFDLGYIDKEAFDTSYNHASSISKQISGFMNYLKNSDQKGRKYS